ncbi:DNA polymerase III subunit beta [Companilactobacillus sp. RD055328]|uniref:DNA polymerase III subunit beta n=1 Tax=Companilactobacillus sp. RD055328 TaxID=2916634 RepID=UPI001FC8CCED|nr:DNA polymerase III subunit beta [Companilactobacillus sp. RD055328]GKQ43408.1 DNA polymerase III subunit beta [Companilactobacillus sp. RD055328]
MKFSIDKSKFVNNINTVLRAISSKTTIPILSGIYLDLKSEGLTISGSDADISITTFIDQSDADNNLTIESTGSIVLTARFFSEIIKKLPGDTLSINVLDNKQTIISAGKSEFTINGIDAVNYPHLPEVATDSQITLSTELLKEVVNQTVIAVSNQESRPILTGVNLNIKEGNLKAVATDSHRLSQRNVKIDSSSDYDFIIPGKSLLELTRTINENISEVKMSISENQVLFSFGDTLFYSRLLEGNYPETDRLIPETSNTTVTFDASALLASVERASLLSHESRNNVIRLQISSNNNLITIYGNSPEVGTVEENVPFTNITGEDLEISFNPDYLKDSLKVLGSTEITMKFTSPLHPFTIEPLNNDEDFIQLITPVRTY